MNMHWPNKHRLSRSRGYWVQALFLALALGGCGGGVDSGGTGAPLQSFASGPITGFGSVIVNGVRFDDTLASVTDDDGVARSRGDLRLGMTAGIRGSTITTDASGSQVSTASTIAFGSELLGKVDGIDSAGSRLTLLGQSVDVLATTVFDDTSLPGGLASLAIGDVVEVYALLDAATGRYKATRIERKGAVSTYRLRGIVSRLDTQNRSFSIGGARISYAGSMGAPPASLADGSMVRVRLQTARVADLWLAAGLGDGVQTPMDHDDVRLEGLISAFTSAARFSVNGIAVDASGISPPAGLALGVHVEVEGLGRAGVLVASKVATQSADDAAHHEFELRGPVMAVDASSRSFVLRGVTVEYALSGVPTEFRNGTAATLAAGVNVEVRGMLWHHGTRLLASRVTFR